MSSAARFSQSEVQLRDDKKFLYVQHVLTTILSLVIVFTKFCHFDQSVGGISVTKVTMNVQNAFSCWTCLVKQ